MPVVVTVEQVLHLAEPAIVEAVAPDSPFAAVFEDDGSTGYFYALDIRVPDQQIQDALQVYSV
jgi:hypothetical protein